MLRPSFIVYATVSLSLPPSLCVGNRDHNFGVHTHYQRPEDAQPQPTFGFHQFSLRILSSSNLNHFLLKVLVVISMFGLFKAPNSRHLAFWAKMAVEASRSVAAAAGLPPPLSSLGGGCSKKRQFLSTGALPFLGSSTEGSHPVGSVIGALICGNSWIAC